MANITIEKQVAGRPTVQLSLSRAWTDISSTYRKSKDDSWIVQSVAQSQRYTGFIIAKFSLLSEVSPKPNTLPLCYARFGGSKGGFEPVIVLWIDTANIINTKGIIIIRIPMMWYKVTNIFNTSQYTYFFKFLNLRLKSYKSFLV
jgi:hypothetical protein